MQSHGSRVISSAGLHPVQTCSGTQSLGVKLPRVDIIIWTSLTTCWGEYLTEFKFETPLPSGYSEVSHVMKTGVHASLLLPGFWYPTTSSRNQGTRLRDCANVSREIGKRSRIPRRVHGFLVPAALTKRTIDTVALLLLLYFFTPVWCI